MKKIWKWIIGILIVLVVVAGLVAVPLIMQRTMLARVTPKNLSAQRGWKGPNAPQLDNQKNEPGLDNRRGNPMLSGQRGWGGRMPFGMFGMGFMLIGMFFRVMLPLVLFGLLLFGVYQLGKRSGTRSTLKPAPAATQVAPADADDGGQPVG
jgi:hypothetical protein